MSNEENYEDMIIALGKGIAPNNNVKLICLGRDKEIEEINIILDKVAEGKAFTKFINGEYGAGKSFFLKVIEEIAYEKNFVVSKISCSNNLPFNKIDVVYKNIVKNLKDKNGYNLESIINNWLRKLKIKSCEELDISKQDQKLQEYILKGLDEARKYSNSFVQAVSGYYKLISENQPEEASIAMAWLRGDSNIPASSKKLFNVKGDVNKENAIDFIEALSAFIKSIGYSGLVILIDEAEDTMQLHTQKIRDTAYNYIRDIYDDCSFNKFKNTLFIFAGTPQFFEDDRKGIASYGALNDRISDTLNCTKRNIRKPIINLEGFNRNDLTEISNKIMTMHGSVYKWDPHTIYDPVLEDILNIQYEDAALTGGLVTPRKFIKLFVESLDIVEQNPDEYNSPEDLLSLFVNENSLDDELEDDW